MNKYSLTMKIRKEGITSENYKLFVETYNINLCIASQTDIKALIQEFTLNKNRKVYEYYLLCASKNVKFSMNQYDILKEFKKEKYKDSMSKEYFKAAFGDNWEPLYNEKLKSCTLTLDYYIEKYGNIDGQIKYQELNKRKSGSLETFIERHGVEEGTRKYNEFCEKNKGNFSLERMISLYGDEDGRTRHSELMYKLKHKNTIYYYIDKFGLHDGQQRYFARNYKNSESTKLNSIRKFGTPAYIVYRAKKELSGDWMPISNMTDFEKYRMRVNRITKNQNFNLLKNFEKRGHQRDKGTYAIDHIISVKYGFLNNVPPEVIGDLSNLQMLPHSINASKNSDSYCVLEYSQR